MSFFKHETQRTDNKRKAPRLPPPHAGPLYITYNIAHGIIHNVNLNQDSIFLTVFSPLSARE